MHSLPGEECECEKIYGNCSHEKEDDTERCDQCGTPLEWSLGVDGVTRQECPNCS